MSKRTLRPELFEAAIKGNTEILEQLRKHEKGTIELADPNVEERHDEKATEVKTQPEIQPVQLKTQVAPPVQAADPFSGVNCNGDTVLHIAVHFRQTTFAKNICQTHSSLLMEVNNKHETPLHYAAQTGNIDLIKYFITLASEGGNNINLRKLLQLQNTEGETALYQAVYYQHKEVVEVLADQNAPGLGSTTPASNECISPLYLAAMLDSLPIVTHLLLLLAQDPRREAYIGPDGRSALHCAAMSKDTRIVEEILGRKPELAKELDVSGCTPLHYAASVNNHLAAALFLENDRNLAYTSNSSGSYPMHVAAKSGHLEVLIEIFKKCPATAGLIDRQGRNFLHLAVEEKRVSVVRWACKNIIELEKEIFEAKDDQGDTLLHLAVKTRDPAMVCHLLLRRGVPLNGVNKNWLTPLDLAQDQLKDGSPSMQNPNYVIYNTLHAIGCSCHKRTPAIHIELDVGQQNDKDEAIPRKMENNGKEEETKREIYQEYKEEKNSGIEKHDKAKEIKSQMKKKEEEIKKEMDNCENMAKSMAIGSVLIASATFASAFSVYNVYKNTNELGNTHYYAVVEVFFLLDAFSFLCAAIATGLLVEAALAFLDVEQRKKHLVHCTELVMMAARCFVIAFTFASYLVLAPFHKRLAILIYCMGAIAPFLIQPRSWTNTLVFRTLVKYRVRAGLMEVIPRWIPLLGNMLYLLIMADVLLSRLTPSEGCHFPYLTCESTITMLVVAFLLVISWDLLRSVLQERTRKLKKFMGQTEMQDLVRAWA